MPSTSVTYDIVKEQCSINVVRKMQILPHLLDLWESTSLSVLTFSSTLMFLTLMSEMFDFCGGLFTALYNTIGLHTHTRFRYSSSLWAASWHFLG
jgi:hypothetical protein